MAARMIPSSGSVKERYIQIHTKWRKRNPNQRPNLTDNALMIQRRFIERQNKLSGIEIDNIKQRVESEFNVQNSQTDSEADDVFVEEANNATEETNEDEVEPSQSPSVIEDLAKEIRRARA